MSELRRLFVQITEDMVTLEDLARRFSGLKCTCGGQVKTIGISKAESQSSLLFVVVGACESCNQQALASFPGEDQVRYVIPSPPGPP